MDEKNTESTPKSAKRSPGRMTRREFLKFTVTGAAVGAAVDIADQVFAKGWFLKALRRFLLEPSYREKALNVVASGQVEDKLGELAKEFAGTPDTVYEFGEKLSATEPWLDQGFAKYQIFKLKAEGEAIERTIILGDVASIFVVQSVKSPRDSRNPDSLVSDFTATQDKYHGFATLPGQQYDRIFDDKGGFISLPMTYCEYLDESGNVQVSYDLQDKKEKGIEQSTNPRAGALIVTNDGNLRIVGIQEAQELHVGGDIIAKETLVYTVSSKSLQKDLDDIDAGNSFMNLPLTKQNLFNALLVSFMTPDGRVENKIIGVYTHVDPNTLKAEATPWASEENKKNNGDVFSLRQIARLCEQVLAQSEGDFTEFTIAVTDTRYQGRVDGPVHFDSGALFTQRLGYETDTDIARDFSVFHEGTGPLPFNPVKRPDFYLGMKNKN